MAHAGGMHSTRPLAGGARTDDVDLVLVSSAIDIVNNGWRAYWATQGDLTENPGELTVTVFCGPTL